VGWVFFRAPDFATAVLVLRKIAGLEPGGATWFYLPLLLSVVAVVAAHAAAMLAERRNAPQPLSVVPRSAFAAAFIVVAWLLGIFLLSPLRTSPFIYFQF
jgi:hypothetical protein